MDKNVEISMLLSFYGNILTSKQAEAAQLYYNEDLSLSEIADIAGITRQGVRDNIKRAEAILYDMEDKLGLCGRFLKIKDKLADIDKSAAAIEKFAVNSEVFEEVGEEIKKIADLVIDINDSF